MPNKMTEKNKIITIELTVEEANTVLAGLQELPAKTANPLTQKILKQAQEQLPKNEEESKTE
jgi:hypothetical protein